MINSYIISQYPLTLNYLDRFSEAIGERPEALVISNITASSYLSIFWHLLRLKAHVLYLPMVDNATTPLMPVLKCLSIVVRAKKRILVEPDFSMHAFGMSDGMKELFGIGLDFLLSMGNLSSYWLKLHNLPEAPLTQFSGKGMKRILYIKPNLWLGVGAGGAIAHTKGIITSFLAKNYRVDFASAEPPISLRQDSKLQYMHMRPPKRYVVPRDLNYFSHSIRSFKMIIKKPAYPYEFIYQRHSAGSLTGVFVSHYLGLPLVLEYNGSEIWLSRNWGRPLFFAKIAQRAEDACLKHASLIVTVSDVLRDELIGRGVEPKRIVSCPNGVNTDEYDSQRFSKKQIMDLRKTYGIKEDAVVVTFVGTFGHWHGVEELAKALRLIVEHNYEWLERHKLHFMFVGDGAKRELVEEILSSSDIKPFYTLTGLISQNDTALYMAASDIFVSPHVPNPDGTPFFGSPTKLFEYLSIGRPIIASKLYQIGEILEGCPMVTQQVDFSQPPQDGACGIMVMPRQTEELKLALQLLVENPDWCRQAGINGRKRAQERYTWDHHTDTILKKMQSILTSQIQTAQVPEPKRPVRVLINALHSKSGGGVTYLRNMLPLLSQDLSLDIHLCIHKDQLALLPTDLGKIKLHLLDFRSSFWGRIFWEQILVPRLGQRIKSDLTFSPANFCPFFANKNVILLRNALSVASIEKRSVKLGYWAMLYVSTACSMMVSRKVISVSKYALRSSGSALTGKMLHKTVILHHGIHTGIIQRPNNSERQDFLLSVSDIYVQKNYKNLLLSVLKLKEKLPNILIKIAGRAIDTEYFSELNMICEKYDLGNNIEFLGHQSHEQLIDLYCLCKAFVFPSTIETFGNPLTEAMSYGTPIACSQNAAMPEVVGDAAIYFDPNDVNEMAEKIEMIYADADLRSALGKKAIERSSLFSWQRTAQQTAAVLKEVALED